MGVWTEYDVLTGNPGKVFRPEEENKKTWDKLYKWQNKVRVLRVNGAVTDIGKYNGYGSIVVQDEEFYICHVCHDGKFDGYLMHDYTYNCILAHPRYDEIIGVDLYKAVDNYIKNLDSYREKLKEPANQYVGLQDIYIGGENSNIDEKDAWVFVNPEMITSEAKRNKKRIKNIVHDFILYTINPPTKKNICSIL